VCLNPRAEEEGADDNHSMGQRISRHSAKHHVKLEPLIFSQRCILNSMSAPRCADGSFCQRPCAYHIHLSFNAKLSRCS